jgi:hypothetical protein
MRRAMRMPRGRRMIESLLFFYHVSVSSIIFSLGVSWDMAVYRTATGL